MENSYIFELNGKVYKTDLETIELLRSIVRRARSSGDASAVIAIMGLGLKSKRIQEQREEDNNGR